MNLSRRGHRALTPWRRLALAVIAGALLGLILFDGRSLALSLVTTLARLDYPGVRWVSSSELADTRPAPLVLDVREPAEFEVSHLAGARRIDPVGPLPPDLLALPRGTPIVTYCAVGRRSARVASALQAAGFTNVRNLDGSIFRWANEGRPLEQAGLPGNRVHPYNRLWSLLLRPERRAPLLTPPSAPRSDAAADRPLSTSRPPSRPPRP